MTGTLLQPTASKPTAEGGDMDDNLEVSAERSDDGISITASGNGTTILKAAGIVAIAAICLI